MGGRGGGERRVQEHAGPQVSRYEESRWRRGGVLDLGLKTLFFFGRALDGAGVLGVHLWGAGA